MSAAERLAKKKAVRRSAGEPVIVCRLRERREALGLSLREVAEAMGDITHAALGMWEVGECRPALTNAYRIARFFGCTVYELWPEPPADDK